MNSSQLVTHWGTYEIQTAGTDVSDVRASPADLHPSHIGRNLVGASHTQARVMGPFIRRGWLESTPRSKRRSQGDDYVAVEWKEALDLVANELTRIRSEYGNGAIFGGSYGWGSAGRFHHAQSQIHRFLNSIGGYVRSVNTYSHAVEEVMLPYIVGDREWFLDQIPTWEDIRHHSELVVSFGGLPKRSTHVTPGGVGSHEQLLQQQACLDNGVRFVMVSPNSSETYVSTNETLAPRPGTDVALMLALTFEIIRSDLADWDFVSRCCRGGEQVRSYLFGEYDGIRKDAGWASQICGIDPVLIRRLAHDLATQRSLITVSWALQRQQYGESTYWAAFTLAAFAGSMGRPGGGIGTGYSSMHNAHLGGRLKVVAALPQLTSAITQFIPVARIADMLLNPNSEFTFRESKYTYPDIRLIYWVGGNPFHHHQDLNKLMRAWNRPETVIVHEPFWTATAKRADIVLPSALPFERVDLAMGLGDPWLQFSEQAVEPPLGILTDYQIFCELAERLGVLNTFSEGRSSLEWIEHLYDETRINCLSLGVKLPAFSEFITLKRINIAKSVEGTSCRQSAFELLRSDPSRFPIPTESGRIELFSETIAALGYSDCPGFGAWIEPSEWLGSKLADTFPLHLISHQPDNRLHSQLDFGAASQSGKRSGYEVARVSPQTASNYGLSDGDAVLVFNARGAAIAITCIDPGLMPQVIQMATGAWLDPIDPSTPGSIDKAGNPNVLTLDIGSSAFAQGPSAHTCLVQIERWEGSLPPLTAFNPPKISSSVRTSRTIY